MKGDRLKHLIKLILLGPQPKDEWHEEWSKDPLAEWFREQRRINSAVSIWDRLRRSLADNWRVTLPYVTYMLCFLLLPDRYRDLLFCFFVPLLIVFFMGWKDKAVGFRPPVRFRKLFHPGVRIQVVLDLWASGLRGSDIARCIYVEQRTGADSRYFAGAMFVAFSAALILSGPFDWPRILGCALLGYWWMMSLLRFIFYSSQNPFESMDWPHLIRGIPGHRAMRGLTLRMRPVQGFLQPLWPIFIMPVICIATLYVVATNVVSPLWLYAAFGGPLVVSNLLMHYRARALQPGDRQLVEDAFLLADRDFDHWVRTELVGDDDA